MRSKHLLLILLFALFTSDAIAQLGSAHYIPPVHARVSLVNATIYLSTPSGNAANPVNVTISRGDGTFLANRQIWNGQAAFYEINLGPNSPLEVAVNELSTPLTGRGFRLEAEELIFASLRTHNFNHAGYLTAKGEEALGTSFRLGSAPLDPINAAQNFFASVMATEDNTTINFSDIAPGVIFQNGAPGTQILNAGESLVVSGYSGPPANNEGFIGALLTSDRPIVVNSGNLRGNLPDTSAAFSDHMIDQIVDQNFTGFEYMLIRGGGNPVLERPLIIANQDDTEIFVNGNPIGVTLNTGEHFLLNDDNLYLPADPDAEHRNMYISTNDDTKSIYVYQFIGGRDGPNDQGAAADATPGMNFIPPLSCFFQNDVDLIPALDEIYPGSIEDYRGNLLITSFIGNTVNVNGVALNPADALQNPGTADWETYFERDLSGDVVVVADGPIALGLFGTDNESAGFGGYYSGFAVEPDDTTTEVCILNGPINLFDRIEGNPPPGGVWTPPLDSGGNIFDPLTDPISNPSLIYNYDATGECEVINLDVTVILLDNPALDTIEDIEACDTFSLPDPATLEGDFLNNPQYFSGPQTGFIPPTPIDWTIPITTTTTVWVYDELVSNPQVCPDELFFEVTINVDPIANPVPPQLVCDDITNDGIGVFNLDNLVATILGVQSGLEFTVTFHESALDATNGDNPILTTAAYNATSGSIFARIENNISEICFDTTEISLTVNELPIANPVPPIIVCDDDSNDGEEIFDLTALEPIILDAQDPADFDITFHPTLASAEAGMGAFTGVDAITLMNGDSIFARIENNANTACFAITEITITIDAQPIATDPDDFGICDNPLDGSDTNGFVEFNLTSRDTFILNGQDPALFTVSYHESLADAQNNTNPLPALHTNATVNSQTIHARVENNANTTCDAIIDFEIIVHPLPIIIDTPVLLTQCDDDTDGFSIFNLTQAEPLLSADFGNETFTYSDLGGTPIVDPINYTNQIVNNETINVTITTVNGCSRPAQIDLEVDTSQIPPDFLVQFTECDTDSDGIADFDFSSVTAQVLDIFPVGQLLTVTYYETLQEAQTEVNAIADISMYSNNLAFTDANGVQGIWVRVDGDTANDCLGLGIHVTLTVSPNPTLNTDVTDLVVCSPVANSFTFDLTVKDAEITGGDPDILVSYYESLGAYIAETPIAVPTAYTNLTNPQTIFYSAENSISGCETFDPDTTIDPDFSFDLIVNQNPILFTPSDLEVCDNDGIEDGFTTMDLTERNLEITGGFDPELLVSYHIDFAGAQANDASIPDPTVFINTTNPQIVVARVENIITGCFATENLRVEVFLNPVAIVPAPYEECDPDNDGIFDFFILSSRDAEITGGDASLTVVYYLTEADANNAPVGLEIDNMMFINNDPFTQTVWARVFNDAGCFDVVPLELVVLNTPMPNPMPDAFEVCDDNADGVAIFDLTTQEAQILGGLDPAVFSVSWFIDQATADAGTPEIANPAAHISNSTTVVAIVTDIVQSATTFCTASVTLELIVNPLPIPIQPAVFEICDDIESGSDIDEFATFDLRSKDDEITGGNEDWIVSYHLTELDAEAGTPTLADMYQNVVMAGETIWVRVEDVVTGCFDLITMTLVVNPLPSPTSIPAVEECDDDGDGAAIFDLTTDVTTDIINGEAFMVLSFHETPEAAEIGTPIIADPANYLSTGGTLWVRATDTDPATATECFRVIEIELVVLPSPVLPAEIPDLTICDPDEDGQAVVNITENQATILGTQALADFNLTYHETLVSAMADTGTAADMPIADPSNYLITASPTTIFVRLEDAVSGCTNLGQFDVIIAPQPIFTPPPAILEACDSAGATVGTDDDGITTFDLTSLDAGIVAGDPDLTVSYFESQADLDAGIPIAPADAFINTTSPQTIFIQISSTLAGMCDVETTINLVVNPLPSPTSIPAVEECDDDGDGAAIFDLTTDVTTDIINGEAFMVLSFHETPEAAEIGTPIIADPANYLSTGGTLWVRATDTDPATATECFRVIEIELVVLPIPVLPAEIPDLTICDPDEDGQAVVNITENQATILGTQTLADFNLTYHETLVSAMADTGTAADMPIADPSNYLITASPTTIFVRLENAVSGCTNLGQFDVIIAPQPIFTPPPAILEACDSAGATVGTDDDGITTFDLTSLDAGIVAGDPDLTVSYFESQADLDAGIPIAPADAFINTTSPQTIFIQISSTLAGMCDAETTINLVVNPLPVLPEPLAPIIACDDDDDGFAEFDLQTYATTLLAGLVNIDLRFYETFDNAQADTGAGVLDITVPYNNISGMTQLFIVAQDTDPATLTACSKIFPVDLIVFTMPELPTELPDITLCDEDGDGQELFDLTQNQADILGTQDPADFTITYHNDQASAEDPTPADAPFAPIANPANYISSGTQDMPEIIWVRLENADGTENTCFAVGNFGLIVEPLPMANPTGEDLNQTECDDDDDEILAFDLTLDEAFITGGIEDLEVIYYASLADLASDTPIANPAAYENITNPQTIQVVLTSASGCSDQISFDIFVLPLPTPNFNPVFPELCDGDGAGDTDDTDGITTFDLTGVIADIQGTENVTITVFDDLAFAEIDPLDPTNAIPDVTAFTNATPGIQTLFARVDSNVPGNFCFVIVPFDVIVNPLPEIDPAFDGTYIFCEDFDGDDTMGTIDLDTLADELGLLAPPQSSADFIITYHGSQGAADAGFPALNSPYEATDGEVLFIRIENTATGCLNFADVTITVESNPLSMEPDDMIRCADNLGINIFPNQDSATFPLTDQNDQITNNTAGISVIYYTSLEDAENEANAISNPAGFVNTSNPQTIWATAENDSSLCSSEIVSFDIFVEPLPYTDLTDEGDVICVDPFTGEILESFTIDGTVETPLPNATYDYEWTVNGTLVSLDPVVTIDQGGTYQVTITATYDDGTGPITTCDYIAEAIFTPISGPVFSAAVLENSFNTGGVYTVEVTFISAFGGDASDYEYALDDGPFQTSTTFTGVTPGTHTVFGRRIGADCSVTEVEIGIIDYPRFFTPNNDGFHDTWNIIGIGVNPNLNAKIFIFDRYGKLLKQLSPTSPGWDGTYGGQLMPSNDYWFRVEFTEPDEVGTQRTFQGHFTLKR